MTKDNALAVLLTAFTILTACAASEPVARKPDLDPRQIPELMNCPSNQTPICMDTHGQPTRCYCADRAELEDVLSPDNRR